MARRGDEAPFGKNRWVGDLKSLEVHDLECETDECHIPQIEEPRTFSPDTLEQARNEGFKRCVYCMGSPKSRPV